MTPCITEGAPADSPDFHQPERAQYGPPASYTTSEGANYKLPSTRHYSSHLHRLLLRRSLHLGQWRHRYTQYTPYTNSTSPPGFDVANYHQIFPIAHDKLAIPNTNIMLDAFVFHDVDLHSNLFGIAPLTQHGLSTTYTDTDLQISAPTTHGPRIIIYGAKNRNANVWCFSLPKTRQTTASDVVRHEQHAELVLYASATFGSPTTKTFYHAFAVRDGLPTTLTSPPR
jgi:hypothetical protein